MTIPEWQKFLELVISLVSVLTWPVLIFILVCTFRAQITEFFTRLIELGPAGVKAAPPLFQIPVSTSEKIADVQHGKHGLALPPSDEVIASIEKNLEEGLEKNGLGNLSALEQKRLFLREYATLARQSHFQTIAQQIFGTQIALLRQLDSGPPQSKAAIMPVFKEHKQRVAHTGITSSFPGWMSFMLDSKLVKVDEAGRYLIAAWGSQFLHLYAPTANVNETTRLY